MKNLVKFLSILVLVFASSFAHAEPVNVNTANAAEIAQSLKGIGPKKAQAIIDYRSKHGAFKSADELVNVKGIGAKTLVIIRKDVLLAANKQESGKKTRK